MIIIAYITVIVFIIGASMGSFFNALSERLYKGEDFVYARSKCVNCSHVLSAFDLVPVLSYLLLRGKCRYCKEKIPMNLFISEVILGILYALSFLAVKDLLIQDTFLFIIYWGFLILNISFFFFIGIYDYKYYLIPDKPVYFLTAFYAVLIIAIWILHRFGYSFLYYGDFNTFAIQHFVTAILLFVFFLSIYLFTKGRGIGGGDVKLSLLIGLLLGARPTIIFLYVAFFSGAIISVLLLLLRSRNLKDSIPFGPFLGFGVIIAILYSGYILNTPLFSFINYFSLIL